MTPIAENTTVITKKLFAEGMAAASDYKQGARKGLGLVGIIWLVMMVFTYSQGIDLSFMVMETLMLLAIALWLGVMYPKSQYTKAYKGMRAKGEPEPVRVTKFYNRYCIIETEHGEVRVDYSSVAKMERTKHLLVITCRDKSGMILDLQGFTVGDVKTVEGLIKDAH